MPTVTDAGVIYRSRSPDLNPLRLLISAFTRISKMLYYKSYWYRTCNFISALFYEHCNKYSGNNFLILTLPCKAGGRVIGWGTRLQAERFIFVIFWNTSSVFMFVYFRQNPLLRRRQLTRHTSPPSDVNYWTKITTDTCSSFQLELSFHNSVSVWVGTIINVCNPLQTANNRATTRMLDAKQWHGFLMLWSS